MKTSYGRHVKYVCQLADPELLRAPELISAMLTTLCTSIGMRPLGAVHIYSVEEELSKLGVEPFEDEGGVTGVVVLSTSHIGFHGWPLRGLAILDVFSCRDFDAMIPADLLRRSFDAKSVKVNDLSGAMCCPDDFRGPIVLE